MGPPCADEDNDLFADVFEKLRACTDNCSVEDVCRALAMLAMAILTLRDRTDARPSVAEANNILDVRGFDFQDTV